MKKTVAGMMTLVLVGMPLPGIAADLVAKGAEAAPPPHEMPLFFINDNKLSLSYQFSATDPGISGTFGKKVVSFTHFDVWALGTNFLNIDVLKSARKDVASPCGNPITPVFDCTGSTEFYGFFRSTLGLNQLLNIHAFGVGPLQNVSLEAGADAETQNVFLAPAKRSFVAGLEFSFALPYHGHFNISPLYFQEWNHNTFATPLFNPPGFGIPSGNISFNGTWALELNYAMDLGFLPPSVPLTFSGYSNFYGPKGNGVGSLVPGTPKRAVEFNSEQRLTLDVGKMVGGMKSSHAFDVFVGYRYWQNKFGLDHTKEFACTGVRRGSCTERSVVSGVSVTF